MKVLLKIFRNSGFQGFNYNLPEKLMNDRVNMDLVWYRVYPASFPRYIFSDFSDLDIKRNACKKSKISRNRRKVAVLYIE